ncbi:hypothetical protein CC78DRAFT_584441 [Lojkania enalia]|uniref:Uncharacterized protein n=1 Tax=Lojkania enalia TaxID=147567 RepID=A0A9P4MZX6_9PLEO|nr:hypothetical protein CC78DRAFT_584441 [Didymosphaeria enalia]
MPGRLQASVALSSACFPTTELLILFVKGYCSELWRFSLAGPKLCGASMSCYEYPKDNLGLFGLYGLYVVGLLYKPVLSLHHFPKLQYYGTYLSTLAHEAESGGDSFFLSETLATIIPLYLKLLIMSSWDPEETLNNQLLKLIDWDQLKDTCSFQIHEEVTVDSHKGIHDPR